MSKRTDLFIFIGPPGSGKGSLSYLCTSQLGWIQLSTGNLCRKHIAEQTEIGKQIDFAIKSDKLVSDSLVTSAVEAWFSENVQAASGIILDGFPRTVAQAQALQQLVEKYKYPIRVMVIRFSLSDEVVLTRLCNRYVCVNASCQAVYSLAQNSGLAPRHNLTCDTCGQNLTRRKDDEEAAVRERLKIYHKHEQELLNYYLARKQSIAEFNVERPLNMIFEDFRKLIVNDTR